MIESSQLKKLIDIDYFPARTLDDVLTHEIGGHKRHWEQAKKIMHEKGIALQDAKDILDVNLRTYVENLVLCQDLVQVKMRFSSS